MSKRFNSRIGESISRKSFYCAQLSRQIPLNTRILNARCMRARKLFEVLRSYGSFTLSRNYTIVELAGLTVLKAQRAPTHLSFSFSSSFFSFPSFFIFLSVMSDSYPLPTHCSASSLGFLYKPCLPSF